MTKLTHEQQGQKLFAELRKFLNLNASMVADARDSNDPWDLLERVQQWEARDQRKLQSIGKKK